MRLALVELRLLPFDIAAFMGLTVWSSDGFQPWWGALVALAAAATVFAALAGLSATFRALTRRLTPRRRSDAVAAGADGLTVTRVRPARTTSIAWPDIAEIVAFKTDLYTFDCITLAVGLRSGETVTIDETMDGWDATLGVLSDHLACEPWTSWFVDVAFPAFAPNARRVYPVTAALRDVASHAVAVETIQQSKARPAEDAPDEPRFNLGAYAGIGTAPLLIAVAVLLTALGAFEHRGFGLAIVAATLVAYTIVSRIVIIALLAIRPAD